MLLALMQAAEPFAGDGAGAAWRGLLAIGVVLGLMALLAWLVRRGHLPLRSRAGRGGVSIESALPLGERRSLVIVAVEGRRLLLGLTPMQVSLVTELAPAPTFGTALHAAEAKNDTGFGFRADGAKNETGFGVQEAGATTKPGASTEPQS